MILLQYGGGSPVPTKKSRKITNYQKKLNGWDKIPTLAIFLGLPWTGMMISSLSTRNTWYIMYGFRKTLLVQMQPSSQKNRDFCPVKRIMFTIWQKDIGRACLSEGGSENCWTLCTFETLNTSLTFTFFGWGCCLVLRRWSHSSHHSFYWKIVLFQSGINCGVGSHRKFAIFFAS